jgi:hypothetical protein
VFRRLMRARSPASCTAMFRPSIHLMPQNSGVAMADFRRQSGCTTVWLRDHSCVAMRKRRKRERIS